MTPMMTLMMAVFPLLLRLPVPVPVPTQRFLDLPLLLLYQEPLHGIVVVMLLDQLLQFPLLLDHRPPSLPLLLVLVLVLGFHGLALGRLLPARDIRPADGELGRVLVVPRLVPRVVDADQAAGDVGAAEVVHGEVAAALVLVLEPAEPLAPPRLLVPRELEEHGLAVLREDGDDVALGQLVRQAAEVDEGGVAVVGVPRRFGGPVARRGGRVLAELDWGHGGEVW